MLRSCAPDLVVYIKQVVEISTTIQCMLFRSMVLILRNIRVNPGLWSVWSPGSPADVSPLGAKQTLYSNMCLAIVKW